MRQRDSRSVRNKVRLAPAPMILLTLATALLVAPSEPLDAAPDLPRLGNGRILSAIDAPSQGVVDVDEFRETLMAGERVQAIVRAAPGSALRPDLTLLGPTGAPEPVASALSIDLRTARFARFRVAESGERSLRIAGAGGTVGAYEAVVVLLPAVNKAREQATLDAVATTLSHRFSAVPGASVSLVARWRSGGSPLRLVEIRDPAGRPVAVPPAKVRTEGRTVEVRNLVLGAGSGEYVAAFAADPLGAPTVVDVRSTVRSPSRPRARQPWHLRRPEPRLATVAEPVKALGGTYVTFRGENFTFDQSLRVEVGGVLVPIHSSSATHVDVTVPLGVPGATVDVAIFNADGQADQRVGYFQYVVPEVIPTLEPGSGFAGPTPAPPANGTGPGSTSRAIARWDVVPNQTITDKFDVGVVAFHVSGISHVAFSVQGGPWMAASKMVTNLHTGADEYCARLDPALLAPGPIEVRAIAYPTVGIPRVLAGAFGTGTAELGAHSLFLNVAPATPDATCWVDAANGDDATARVDDPARAARTIGAAAELIVAAHRALGRPAFADGGTIFLKAGDHQYGPRADASTDSRWFTITRDPAAQRSAVRISVAGIFYSKLIRVHDVTLKVGQSGSLMASSMPRGDSLWVSNCDVVGAGRTFDADVQGGHAHRYFTDVTSKDTWSGLKGTIVRNVRVERIIEDAFTNSFLVVNSSLVDSDSRQATGDPHPDVYQFYGSSPDPIENRILYGITATDRVWGQGLFSGQLTEGQNDIAVVNCSMNNQFWPEVGMVFQIMGPTNHMYVKDCNFVGPANWRVDRGFVAKDVVVENTWFRNGDGTLHVPNSASTTRGQPAPAVVPGVTYR